MICICKLKYKNIFDKYGSNEKEMTKNFVPFPIKVILTFYRYYLAGLQISLFHLFHYQNVYNNKFPIKFVNLDWFSLINSNFKWYTCGFSLIKTRVLIWKRNVPWMNYVMCYYQSHQNVLEMWTANNVLLFWEQIASQFVLYHLLKILEKIPQQILN